MLSFPFFDRGMWFANIFIALKRQYQPLPFSGVETRPFSASDRQICCFQSNTIGDAHFDNAGSITFIRDMMSTSAVWTLVPSSQLVNQHRC